MRRALQAEIRQTRPFKSLEEEAYLNLVRTAAELEHALAQELKPYGLTATQYNVLRILRGAGEAGLCRNEVGERLVRPVPDVTRLLDRMEETGLLSRRRGGDDRRYVTTRISRHGLDLLSRLDSKIVDFHRRHLGNLKERSLRALIDLLTEVRDSPNN
jgi:DNA-binding MarR family transcriptional regulator